MTAQDAFAIAFDEFVPQEAWAMDRINGPSTNQNRTVGKKGSKKPSNGGGMGKMGGGMGRMGGGMGDMGGTGAMPKKEQSLAEHMAQYHKDGFDPRVNKCKLFDALKKNFERQGLSPEEAEQKALAAHNASGYRGAANRQPQQGGGQQQAVDEEQGRQLAEKMYQQFMRKPSVFAIEDMARQAVLIQPSITMQDANGDDVTIEDTFQLACMMFLQDQKENSGDESIENAAVKAQAQLAEITSGENDGEVIQASSGDGNGDGLTHIKPPPSPSKYYQQKINQAQEKLASAKTDEERAEAQAEIDDATKELEIIKKDEEQFNQTRILSSSSGKTSRPLTAEEEQIIAENPDKEKTLREILDIEERVADNPEMKEGELGDLRNQREQKRIMFYGRDVGSGETTNNGSQRTTAKSSDYLGALDRLHDAEAAHDRTRDLDHGDENKIAAQKALEEARAAVAKFEQSDTDIVDDEGKVIDTGSDRRKWAEQERVIRNAGGNDGNESSGDTQPSDQPSDTSSDQPSDTSSDQPSDQPSDTPSDTPSDRHSDTPSDQPNTPPKNPPKATEYTPPDEQFRTKDGKYKINGIVYNDISGQGFLHSLYSSFLAGLRGEGIITGWDKITGKWDQMKRSASGENVRNGIMGAIANIGIEEYAAKVNDPVAKEKLNVIREMLQKAKTPAQKMAALNQFEKWKKQYLGETSKTSGTNAKVSDSIDEIHKDGKVLGSNQKIDNEGNIVDDSETNKIEPPGTDILGEPGFHNADGTISWHKKPEIRDLDKKKEIIQNTMLNLEKNPIFGKENGATTSFNSTFVKYDIENPISDKQKSELEKQLAFKLGVDNKDVSVSVDNKNHQLIVGVKNDVAADVSTREIMQSDEWKKACETMRCPIIIGRANDGTPVIKDIKDLTHLLIAGDTGKGKSVGMNTILCSMMMARKPSQLKTVLIDLKKMELSRYRDSKHNAVPVAIDIDSAMKSLEFVRDEMENRENLFAEAGVTNIDEYNAKAKAEGKDQLPTVILGIDELTELKSAGGGTVDALLKTIGDKGRASGIHMVCATQKPTKENIGEVKTNFPSRLAFPIKTAEGSEAIFSKGDRRANSIGGKGEFILDVNNVETRGKGSAMGHDDPQRIVGFWNGEKPQTDGKAPGGEGGGESPKLPQERLDAISSAVQNGQPISMEADEGYMDAFKSAFPDDWEITEEETDGKKYWRASPPKPKEGSKPDSEEKPTETDWRKLGSREEMVEAIDNEYEEQKSKAKEAYLKGKDSEANQKKYEQAIEDAEADRARKMRFVDSEYPPKIEEFGEGEHIENENNESNNEEDPEEEDENLAMFDTFSNPAKELERGTASMKKKIADLEKAVQKGEITPDEAEEETNRLKGLYTEAKKASREDGVTAKQIREILKAMDERPESDKPAEEVIDDSKKDTWVSPFEASQKPENRIAAARADFEAKAKEIDKDRNLSVVKKARLKKQLQSEYDRYVDSIKAGKSDEEIYNDTEAIKAKIPTRRKGKPIVGATHILTSTRGTGATVTRMPREIADNVKLPSGFEIDSDEQGNPLWIDGKYGFARDQKTGMYGKIFPDSRFVLSIDPTNPEFKGVDSPEAKAAYRAWMKNDREKNPKKDDELRKKYNIISRGVPTNDEAIDNKIIVANAILAAIEKAGVDE